MALIVYLFALLLGGLFVGALGRLALPGPDPMSISTTILIGIAGSFLAGIFSWLLFGRGYGGIVLSVAVATRNVYPIPPSPGGAPAPPGAPPRGRGGPPRREGVKGGGAP